MSDGVKNKGGRPRTVGMPLGDKGKQLSAWLSTVEANIVADLAKKSGLKSNAEWVRRLIRAELEKENPNARVKDQIKKGIDFPTAPEMTNEFDEAAAAKALIDALQGPMREIIESAICKGISGAALYDGVEPLPEIEGVPGLEKEKRQRVPLDLIPSFKAETDILAEKLNLTYTEMVRRAIMTIMEDPSLISLSDKREADYRGRLSHTKSRRNSQRQP